MNKKTIITSLVTVASTALSSVSLHAEDFNFEDPKGVNNVSFSMDAPLEFISGSANGISGIVTFDADHPKKTSGTITLNTSTLMVSNSMMKDHMHGKNWMDVENHPTIEFSTDGLSGVEETSKGYTATAAGTLTIKGVSKEVELPVTLTYLPGKLGARSNGRMQGDLLVIRSTFTVLRSDYGINPKAPEDKVSNEIELKLSIAGYAAK